MHFKSGENPSTCLRRSFRGHIPLKEGHISILRTDGSGLSPNEPMAIVQMPIESPSIPDGKYIIKNRAADICRSPGHTVIKTLHFWPGTMVQAKAYIHTQVNKHSLIIQVFKG